MKRWLRFSDEYWRIKRRQEPFRSAADRPYRYFNNSSEGSFAQALAQMHSRLLVVLVAMTLGGCPGMSQKDQDKFRSHINQTIANEMSLVKAVELLAKDDFSCDDTGMPTTIDCTRMKHSLLPHSCVQRVTLSTDPERKKIANVETGIACGGL